MAECINILIDKITVDDELQVRDFTRASKIGEYTQRIKDGAHFPPIHCGRLKGGDGTIYLVDGFHRLQAYVNADVERVDVEIEEYEERRLMFAYAFRVNNSHGINMTDPEEESGLDKIIQLFPEKSIRQLVDLTGCTRWKVSQRINQLSGAGQLTRPEKIIGRDGKERPSTVPRPAPQTKQDTPCHFCAGGCGTPIWEEMKDAPDSTYFHIQKNGMTLWFCSEECYRHSWHCPPDEKECEDVEDDEAPVYVKCEHCGKTTTLQEAKDYRKSGWQPVDRDFNRWYCSEECLNAALGDETKPEPHPEPPAREPAPSSSQASGAEPEQEEPDEFAFTDVDEETLPVCTEEHKETDELEAQIIVRVRTKAFKTAQEFVNSLSVIDGKFQIHLFGSDVDAEFLGLYENNNLINNNINTNPEIFTDFYVCCKSKKGREVKLFISKAKYSEWKRQFGPTFDIDQNLKECCKYYNELFGAEMLSAGGVYSKVYAWLLKNWKAQKKEESKPKKNAYKDAGLRFDPSDY